MRKKTKILTALLLISLVRSSYSDMFSGTVYNDENKPLANVQVTVPALQKGVVTDSSGTFHIDIPPGNYAMGFHPK